ncbi:MAG: cytochrome c, partial [Sinobacteraceae bacterium]|nr:cytochrome c [Nevskiaceae bacterium]
MRSLGLTQPWRIAALLVVLGTAAFLAYAWHGELAPISVPLPESFAEADIRRGAQLAALGGCLGCHTTEGGAAYAGGRPIPTPFGIIYSTNITPEPRSGIGHWSQAAFQRAMREGVDRRGRHLYPAFPYDHYTLTTDADDAALYAFLMTRTPIEAWAADNPLSFPLNLRITIAGWKLLFFHAGPYSNDSAHDAAWNRGAYLTEGLGHCGACHTPRNMLGAERRLQPLGGGASAGWDAYALNAASPAPTPWNQAAMFGFLREGWHAQHGDALGPMAEYTNGLREVSDEDLRAIALYVVSSAGAPGKRARAAAAERDTAQAGGAAIYAAACAGCHDGERSLPLGGIELALSSALTADSADNLIHVILEGVPGRASEPAPIMPGFASSMTDQQLESLLA